MERMDSDTPFKTLLEQASDFDLVNGTFVKIGDRYDHWVDAAQYTAVESVIMLVWHSSGLIDISGFEYLFSDDFPGDLDFMKTAAAYKVAGLERGYGAFQSAFRLFPNGIVPHDSEERISQYLLADERIRDEINTEFFKDGWENLRERRLAQFIRTNLDALGPLD